MKIGFCSVYDRIGADPGSYAHATYIACVSRFNEFFKIPYLFHTYKIFSFHLFYYLPLVSSFIYIVNK